MIRVLEGDCRDVLRTLPDASVHCVVTSPPYYGLRDYGTAQWEGGDAQCDHVAQRKPAVVGSSSTLGFPADGGARRISDGNGYHEAYTEQYRDLCGKCGARRIDSQLGLEATPDDYIATMVAVFREVRRVMRPDATLWMNLGDSFADKQLLMVPARLSLALQADGWWLRSDIIWAKPNPMPESVTDRPTNAHEHVFLLTKAPRYYYDVDAVREPSGFPPGTERRAFTSPRAYAMGREPSGNEVDGWVTESGYRNLRNVWTIATAPFPEAHFATFPPALAERCIKAGTSERGCCAQCGAPWVRQTQSKLVPQYECRHGGYAARGNSDGMVDMSKSWTPGTKETTTTGWSPACQCGAPTQPCTVLDPFAGAGTTGLVADRLQRNAVLIELNPAYCAMMRERLTADAPLFMELAAD